MVAIGALLDVLVPALAALDAGLGLVLVAGAVEGQPVRLDALAGDAAALDEPGLDVGLDFQRVPPLLAGAGQVVEHRLAPGDVRLAGPGQVAQQAHGRGVGQRVGGVGVVDVGAHEVRLEHAVDGHQPVDRAFEVPDVLAEPGEVVGGGFLGVAAGAQLLQALAEQVGGLGVVVDVVAEGGLAG